MGVGAFWTDAQSIFETARQASLAGSSDCDWAILIGPRGGIHILDSTGWALPCLLTQHGAQTAYRVTREGGHVRLEGRSGSGSCVLTSETPAETARGLLAGPLAPPAVIAYQISNPTLLPASPPSCLARRTPWTTSA